MKALRKKCLSFGGVAEDDEQGSIIQLSGDLRWQVKLFLLEHGICRQENLKVWGDNC
jgi:translation initiation factor 1 (eIF-1/SUI1)